MVSLWLLMCVPFVVVWCIRQFVGVSCAQARPGRRLAAPGSEATVVRLGCGHRPASCEHGCFRGRFGPPVLDIHQGSRRGGDDYRADLELSRHCRFPGFPLVETEIALGGLRIFEGSLDFFPFFGFPFTLGRLFAFFLFYSGDVVPFTDLFFQRDREGDRAERMGCFFTSQFYVMARRGWL